MKTRLFFVVLFLFATVAFAADAKKTDLQYFAGDWRCTGIGFASPMGPEHATRATVSGTWIVGKQWLQLLYTEINSKTNPHPIDAAMFVGYDEGLKKFVNGVLDSMGGYGTSESDGWSGDSLVFTGDMHMGGTTMKGRDTFTKKSARELVHLGEFQDDKGAWQKTDQETCRK